MDIGKLKGMAVVSVTEGSRLGRVDGLLFEPQALQVAALRVKGDSGEFIVPFDQIKSIGVDAITVESSQVTQIAGAGGAHAGLIDLDQIKKLQVVDAAGTLIGSVETLEIEPTTGRLATLTAHKGGLLGLGGTSATIEAGAVQSVGGEIITISSSGLAGGSR